RPHPATAGPLEGQAPDGLPPPAPVHDPAPGGGAASVSGAADGGDGSPETETAPPRAGALSRRVLIGGVAATAALGLSAFAVFRPDRGLLDPGRPVLRPGGERTDRPGQGVSSPGASGSPAPTAQSTPASSPVSSPAASAEPFGTPVRQPAALPSKYGQAVAMSVSGTTVVCATRKGAVLAWDTAGDGAAGDGAAGDGARGVIRIGDGGAAATSVAAGRVGDRPVVASGHADGRMRLWSLTGESLAGHRAGDPIIAVTVTDEGTAIAVSQKYDITRDLHSVVRLWDIGTGRQIGSAIDDHYQGVHGLAFGRLGGDDVLVTGDGRGRVRVWRLPVGKLRHSFGMGTYSGIELLAGGEVAGRPVVVSTHQNATLRVHDLATGKRMKMWNFSGASPDDRGTIALVAGRLGELPIAAVTHAPLGGDVFVRVWDLDDGEPIGTLGPADGGAAQALALADLGGRPVVAGVDANRTVRIWSLGPP
ncbi:hypothetical protein, partial [Nonomuraea longispora]|uniref:WD40 repeat domain-containing protein n=1 Tax=Nonomuraea longispora TaxID=1848320 RepID=UPI001404A1E8